MSNRLNPTFPGKVTALGFAGTKGTLINTAFVKTTGTTPVSVFGSTAGDAAGFAGSFVGMRITSKDNANGNITLKGTGGATVATIAKGSQGAVTGTVISAYAFTATSTPTLVSSANSADVDVEVLFTVSHE